ncbi:MAG TPA: hypothetical protein PLF40_26330, partial [Kofleriaceae bacterium]|nr:hypothetical protein [Kofleriaceae bacterium]
APAPLRNAAAPAITRGGGIRSKPSDPTKMIALNQAAPAPAPVPMAPPKAPDEPTVMGTRQSLGAKPQLPPPGVGSPADSATMMAQPLVSAPTSATIMAQRPQNPGTRPPPPFSSEPAAVNPAQFSQPRTAPGPVPPPRTAPPGPAPRSGPPGPPPAGASSRRPVPPPFGDEPTRQADSAMVASLRDIGRGPGPQRPAMPDEATRMADLGALKGVATKLSQDEHFGDGAATSYDPHAAMRNFAPVDDFGDGDERTSISDMASLQQRTGRGAAPAGSEERTRIGEAPTAANPGKRGMSNVDWDIE